MEWSFPLRTRVLGLLAWVGCVLLAAPTHAVTIAFSLPSLEGDYQPGPVPGTQPPVISSTGFRSTDLDLGSVFSSIDSIEVTIRGTGSREDLALGDSGCPVAAGCSHSSRILVAFETDAGLPFLIEFDDLDGPFDLSGPLEPFAGGPPDFATLLVGLAKLNLVQGSYSYPIGPGSFQLVPSADFRIDSATLYVTGTPVPEPGSFGLTALGLALLARSRPSRRASRRRP